MKFVISTQELNYLVTKCMSVVPAKSTIPLLSNILVEAANDELILTATDLTVGIRCYTDAKILEEGSTTIPGKHFLNLIRELTSVNVEFSTNSNEVATLVADSSKFKINGMDRSEYPALPDISESIQIKLKQSELKEMLFSTAFAVSKEDNRFALTGVFLQIQDGMATFVGTDGKRLSRSFLPIQVDSSISGQYIVPLKAVEEIEKNLEGEEEATLYLLEDKIAVDAGHTIIITKLLSGDYPDVTKVIPEKTESVVSLHREELTTLLRQVALYTKTDTDSVRFTFSDGELKLKVDDMEKGEGDVSMPVNYHGEKLEIAFNPNFFLDVLRHTKNETVNIGLTDAFNPGLITDQEGVDPSKQSSPLFVLMPMRLKKD